MRHAPFPPLCHSVPHRRGPFPPTKKLKMKPCSHSSHMTLFWLPQLPFINLDRHQRAEKPKLEACAKARPKNTTMNAFYIHYILYLRASGFPFSLKKNKLSCHVGGVVLLVLPVTNVGVGCIIIYLEFCRYCHLLEPLGTNFSNTMHGET